MFSAAITFFNMNTIPSQENSIRKQYFEKAKYDYLKIVFRDKLF